MQRCQVAGCPFDAAQVLAASTPAAGADPATWTAVDAQPAPASYYRVVVVARTGLAANLTLLLLTEPEQPYSARGERRGGFAPDWCVFLAPPALHCPDACSHAQARCLW